MNRLWPIGIASAAAFVCLVALSLPSTELKASWTSVHYAPPAIAPVSAAAAEPVYDGPTVAPLVHYEHGRPVRDGDGDPVLPDGGADRGIAYADGYGWASERDLTDPSRCDRYRGERWQGCRDFVASQSPAADEDVPSPAA